MKIKYKPNFISQNIDVKKLRPGNSYENLQKKKLYFEKINQIFVKRMCPSCNYSKSSLLLKKDGFSIVKCNKCNLIYVNQSWTVKNI